MRNRDGVVGQVSITRNLAKGSRVSWENSKHIISLESDKSTYLDAENKVSDIIAAASGGVAARDLLSVDVGHDGDVLTNGQVQDIMLVRESKLVPRFGSNQK